MSHSELIAMAERLEFLASERVGSIHEELLREAGTLRGWAKQSESVRAPGKRNRR